MAATGFTAVNDRHGTNDCNGHGTHVAGTIGGTTYGVAKEVQLVPVRVLSCRGSGTWSGVIAGVDWVTGQRTANPGVPMVANMSLGGGANASVDAAVASSIAAGVTYAVAAGNDGVDACTRSPARVQAALTVGATGSADARASWSNVGPCLDVFAPGVGITSAWHTSNTATNTISGTSMASPHVAGVAALHLQGSPGAEPAAVGEVITSTATTGVVTSPGSGSPDLLLYSSPGEAGGGGDTGDGGDGGSGGGDGGGGGSTQLRVEVGGPASFWFNRNHWRATVEVSVSPAHSNVTITGAFTQGGSASCSTSSTGACTITSANIHSRHGSTTFTVTGVSGDGVVWDGAAPAPVTINRP